MPARPTARGSLTRRASAARTADVRFEELKEVPPHARRFFEKVFIIHYFWEHSETISQIIETELKAEV